MIKKILAFLLLMMIVSFDLYTESQIPWIVDIALIETETYNKPTPPAEIPIAVEMEDEAYYKLSDKEKVIKGGLFHKGLNILHIEASHFFDKSDSHIYFLDLKRGNSLLRKEIEIDIQLESQEKVFEPVEKVVNPEYKLSMFIGDELIITSKKVSPKKIPLKVDLPPWPEEYRPFGPVDTSEYSFNSFSIFSAVGVLQELLKKLKKGKSKEDQPKPIPRLRQITTTFLRRDSEGMIREAKAVITLKTGD